MDITNEQKREIIRLTAQLQGYYVKADFDVYKLIQKNYKKLNDPPEAIIAVLSALNFKRPDKPWAYSTFVRREYYIKQGVSNFLEEHEDGKRQERANAPQRLKEIMQGVL